MLRYRWLVALCISLSLLADANLTQNSKELKTLRFIYDNAVHDFEVGSYYQALDEFSYIIKQPASPYLLPSLYMLAYTYLYIGKRVGDKKYLWDAINYLNLYLAKGGAKDDKYYFLKGLIYENLGFYERAYTNYKLALKRATDKKFRLDILMGLLRSSVWLGYMDQADRYMVILGIETLGKKQQKEFDFLQGMYHFAKKEYKKALPFFQKTYKEFESYLIDNPRYYLLVAETAYRIGDLRFSEMLFRRILNYVKNKEILPQALLRLGDIKFLKKEYQNSVNYYIRIIKTFPKTRYATIAKLKLLYITTQDKKIAHYAKKYLEAPFLQDPLKFVVTTLVKNRGNYVGIFALANFGLETFMLDSDKLYKRLAWELSLIDPNALKYEQIEYFDRLWRPFLMEKKFAKRVCKLYLANEKFFQKSFPKSVLVRIADYLEGCGKSEKSLSLLEYLGKHYKDDGIYLKLADRLYAKGRFQEALEALEKVKHKDCDYYRRKATICFVADRNCSGVYEAQLRACPRDFYSAIFQNIIYLHSDRIDKNFIERHSEDIAKNYDKPLIQKFVKLLATKLIEHERYDQVIELLGPIASKMGKDCFLDSILALSYVRTGRVKLAQDILENVGECANSWYNLATIAVENAQLQQKLKGL